MQKYFNLAAAIIGFSSLIIVLALQYGLNMQPCPLCIFERIVVLIISVLLFASYYIDRVYLKGLIGMFFFKGILLAGYHSYILMNPENTCAIFWLDTLLRINMQFPWLNWLLESKALCGQGQDKFLGVLLPVWVLILLAGMAYFAYYSYFNITCLLKKKAPDSADA